MNLVRVTEVLACWKDGLDQFKQDLGPRADQILDEKASFSRRMHSALTRFAMDGIRDCDEDIKPFMDELIPWAGKMMLKTIVAGTRIIDLNLGLSGEPDWILDLKHDQGVAIVDFKFTAGRSKKWPLQLGGYNLLYGKPVTTNGILHFRKNSAGRISLKYVPAGDPKENTRLFANMLELYRRLED